MIMSLTQRFSATLFGLSLLWFTGCVGPMACGPNGSCGPIAFGTSCDGCGECEGCGELYVDPWINDPADCCDPCDKCGNHNGQSCGKCRSVFDGIASLWGYRCDSGCDDCGNSACGGGCGLAVSSGCDSSCGGCDSCYGASDGLMHITAEPTPAKQIVEAVPADAPFKPQRTRKIFQPRPSVAAGPPQSSDY